MPSTSPPKRRPSATKPAPPVVMTEAEAREFYATMYAMRAGKGLGFGLFLYAAAACGPFGAGVASKIALLHTYSLGYVYLAWLIVFFTRQYATLNSNGARAPTGIDRPDQHAYATPATKVSMVTEGDVGKFNRAQRGAFNLDETIAVFISGLLLHGAVLGPVAVLVAAVYSYGAVVFCNQYKEGGNRGDGFRPRMNAEWTSAGLVFICAIKALAGPLLPY